MADFDQYSQTDNVQWEDFTPQAMREFIERGINMCVGRGSRDDLEEYGFWQAMEEINRRLILLEQRKD